MSWTYDPTLSTARDRVRRYIGDVQSADPQLQDEEIEAILVDLPTPILAAVEACEFLAAQAAREVNRSISAAQGVGAGISISASDRQEHYLKLGQLLRSRAARRSGIVPVAGGISIADKELAQADSGRTPPAFSRDMMVIPGQPTVAAERSPGSPPEAGDVFPYYP